MYVPPRQSWCRGKDRKNLPLVRWAMRSWWDLSLDVRSPIFSPRVVFFFFFFLLATLPLILTSCFICQRELVFPPGCWQIQRAWVLFLVCWRTHRSLECSAQLSCHCPLDVFPQGTWKEKVESDKKLTATGEQLQRVCRSSCVTILTRKLNTNPRKTQ